MKILLINIRYGYVGGPERYLFNVKNLLELKGHSIIPFSIKYPINEPSEYEKYFVSPLSADASVYFKDQRWNVRSFFKTLSGNFYSQEVEKNLSALIDDTKPDFALVLLYLRKLSPAVLVVLHRKKIPFAIRLSDYAMICPALTLFRNGQICERCVRGSLWNSVKYRCVHDSYGASLVNFLATKYHHAQRFFGLIRHFISPSRFLITQMTKAGYDEKKFHHIPNFAYIPNVIAEKKKQIVYAGRIEYVKGVHLLLDAIRLLAEQGMRSVTVKIAGNGNEKYIHTLQRFCQNHGLMNVEFCGNLEKEKLIGLLAESAVSVIPSLWYDNFPNAALESLSCGTPVIAPNQGSFPEMVRENETGFLFHPASAASLAEKVKRIFNGEPLLKKMFARAVEVIRLHFSPEKHYTLLMSVMEKIKSAD